MQPSSQLKLHVLLIPDPIRGSESGDILAIVRNLSKETEHALALCRNDGYGGEFLLHILNNCSWHLKCLKKI